MQLLSIILQAAPGGFDPINMIFLFGIFFAAMYFFSIRPQQKKAKEQQTFIDELKKGDKIITASGIHGKIVRIDENTLLIEVDTNTKLRIEKSAISSELSIAISTTSGKEKSNVKENEEVDQK